MPEKPEAEQPEEEGTEDEEQPEPDEPTEEPEGASEAEKPDEEAAEAPEADQTGEAADEAEEEGEPAEEPAAEPEAAEEEPAEEAEQVPSEPAVMVPIVADGKSHFTIVTPPEPTDVESFAASELAKYIERMSTVGVEVQQSPDGVEKAVVVGGVSDEEMAQEGIEEDGFVIDVSSDAIRLFGGRQRGTLFAVYALLEQLGCRWPIPGEDYEHVPHRTAVEVAEGRTLENPRFSVRGFAEDTSYVDHEDEAEKDRRTIDDLEFIDWLAKNRCTHFHLNAPEDVFELLHFELEQRGMGYETGGHIIPDLLPRELFEERPGLFRMSTRGTRQSTGNLCVANPDALDIVRDNFLKYIEDLPEPGLVHFWGADVQDGGWCCCEECRELLPQDQYLKTCNHVAKALEGTGVSIDYIAYHDTLEADLMLEPRPEVVLLFAPRERSYGTTICDPESETNELYADALQQYVAAFDGNAQIFEYYADAMLYGSLAVPLQHVIAEDLAYYEGLGIKRIESLMFGRYSWWAYPLNMYAVARLAWSRSPGIDRIMQDFCEALFGDAADPMRRVYNVLEEGMRLVATYGDIKHPWRSELPMGDIYKNVRSAIEVLASAAEPMERAKQLAEDTSVEPLVLSQYQLWLYTLGEVEGIATQIDGLLEREAAAKAEESLKGKYFRVSGLKLRDAGGISRGGMDIIEEVEDEVKGQWGMSGLVNYHERLIAHLEKLAQEAHDSIPAEPEAEKKEEAAEEAEAQDEDADAAEGESEEEAPETEEADAEATEGDDSEAEAEPEEEAPEAEE